MPATKVVDVQEAIRWIEEEERPYKWIVEEYRRKYGVETTVVMWGGFRRRHGLTERKVRDPELIPWKVEEEHRWLYPLCMLRVLARRRRGVELSDNDEARLDSWLRMLKEKDVVVHYDPDSPDGFYYVPREPTDADVIRKPRGRAKGRRNAD